MGTTLTGLEIKDTYDSLIKVTDNGPLTGSLKKLTDGLGNDSSLSLSTAAASFSGTLAVTDNVQIDNELILKTNNAAFRIYRTTGTAFFDWSSGQDLALGTVTTAGGAGRVELMRIRSTGNVGIGTNVPARMLEVASLADDGEMQLRLRGFASTNSYAELGRESLSTGQFRIKLSRNAVVITPLVIDDQTGVIGISTGIKFPATQVAQADANTLDDYEEGNWTPIISFGGASVGITYSVNQGFYTKIGNQVTTTCYILLTNKGSSTGAARIEGLPFSINASSRGYSAPSFGALSAINFSGQFQGYGNTGVATIDLVATTSLGVQAAITNNDFSNSSQIIMQFTYFV